jgi:hypothetical protein
MESKIFRFLILDQTGRMAWDNGNEVSNFIDNKGIKEFYERIVTFTSG